MFSLVAILFLHYLGFLDSVVSFILVYSNNFIFFLLIFLGIQFFLYLCSEKIIYIIQ